jgi:hypothetical protein
VYCQGGFRSRGGLLQSQREGAASNDRGANLKVAEAKGRAFITVFRGKSQEFKGNES